MGGNEASSGLIGRIIGVSVTPIPTIGDRNRTTGGILKRPVAGPQDNMRCNSGSRS